jgi:hypothetical protein
MHKTFKYFPYIPYVSNMQSINHKKIRLTLQCKNCGGEGVIKHYIWRGGTSVVSVTSTTFSTTTLASGSTLNITYAVTSGYQPTTAISQFGATSNYTPTPISVDTTGYPVSIWNGPLADWGTSNITGTGTTMEKLRYCSKCYGCGSIEVELTPIEVFELLGRTDN